MSLPAYAELQALLAVMDEDRRELHRLLGDMLPGELRTLAEQANTLAVLATSEADSRVALGSTP